MAPLASHVGASGSSQGVTRSRDRDYMAPVSWMAPHSPHMPPLVLAQGFKRAAASVRGSASPPVCRKRRGPDGATGPQPVRLNGHTPTWDPQPPLGLTPGQSAVSFPTQSHRSPDSTAHPGHARLPGPRASPWTPRLQPLCLRPFPLPAELSS